VTVRQRRKKLEERTRRNGLNDTYRATPGRLKTRKGDRSMLGKGSLEAGVVTLKTGIYNGTRNFIAHPHLHSPLSL